MRWTTTAPHAWAQQGRRALQRRGAIWVGGALRGLPLAPSRRLAPEKATLRSPGRAVSDRKVAGTWLRVFRLLRLGRISKLIHYGKHTDGITQTLNPYFAIAIGLKGVMVAVEAQDWWPEMNNLNVVIGVVGFSLAILLGSKLQVINNRLYSLEDAVCRIVGSMREMQTNSEALPHISNWAKKLESVLIYNGEEKDRLIRQMRLETDELGKELHKAGLGGSNTSGFHKDTAYLLHRALSTTPESYEKF